MAQRLCRSCGKWHDLNEDWPIKCYSHFKATIGGGSVQIIKDIEPYQAVAADVDGKRPKIMGRRQHREFLQRNGYREVGNDVPTAPKKAEYAPLDRSEIRRAIWEVNNERTK